ncbi:IclR family transcriptional regulator [Schaalia naturae]
MSVSIGETVGHAMKRAATAGSGTEVDLCVTDVSPVASVDRALVTVERLAQSASTGMSLKELAVDLHMNKATLHHTLAALRFRGWVEQNPDGNYLLGPGTRPILRWWTSDERVSTVLHPVLERISAETNELVHLGRLSHHSILYLDKVEPELALRVWSRIGSRAPAVRTALGRALLGARQVGRDDVGLWLDEMGTPPEGFNERTLGELEAVRTRGYASEVEENESGIACVAVPLQVGGHPLVAISVSAPVERMGPDRMERLAECITRRVGEADLPEIVTMPTTSEDEQTGGEDE